VPGGGILMKDAFPGRLIDQGNGLRQQIPGSRRVALRNRRSKLLDLSAEPGSTRRVDCLSTLVLPISLFGGFMVWHSSPFPGSLMAKLSKP
jgi:hypothetical protein